MFGGTATVMSLLRAWAETPSCRVLAAIAETSVDVATCASLSMLTLPPVRPETELALLGSAVTSISTEAE